jgi:hypothetical protein
LFLASSVSATGVKLDPVATTFVLLFEPWVLVLPLVLLIGWLSLRLVDLSERLIYIFYKETNNKTGSDSITNERCFIK